MTTATPLSGTKRRLSRPDRQRQLLDTAWALIRSEGTAPLTLGRLAEAAGVTKPVAYDHFGSRHGLLAALYEDFDVRQNAIIDAAMASAGPTAQERAAIVAQRYVECADPGTRDTGRAGRPQRFAGTGGRQAPLPDGFHGKVSDFLCPLLPRVGSVIRRAVGHAGGCRCPVGCCSPG